MHTLEHKLFLNTFCSHIHSHNLPGGFQSQCFMMVAAIVAQEVIAQALSRLRIYMTQQDRAAVLRIEGFVDSQGHVPQEDRRDLTAVFRTMFAKVIGYEHYTPYAEIMGLDGHELVLEVKDVEAYSSIVINQSHALVLQQNGSEFECATPFIQYSFLRRVVPRSLTIAYDEFWDAYSTHPAFGTPLGNRIVNNGMCIRFFFKQLMDVALSLAKINVKQLKKKGWTQFNNMYESDLYGVTWSRWYCPPNAIVDVADGDDDE
jgi:hypothetical protein